MSKEDFVTRARNALVVIADPSSQTSSVAGATRAEGQSTSQHTGNVSTESSGQATPSSATEPESNDVQALLAERGVKLEAQQKKAAEEARIRAKAKAEAKAAEAKKSGVPDPQSKHADMLKKKRKDAQEEKRRILQAIEDDKVARKARQAEREAERKRALEIQKEEEASLLESVAATSMVPPTSKFSEICALQVRLFDGSTIRNCFPSGSNLGTDVRNWVDANRGSDKQAYTFKVVLTPLPNKNIETSEESLSLQDLGLTRSSTLVLVPAAKPTAEAYPGNPVSRLIAFILACIAGFFTGIASFFATLFSTSGPSGQEPGRGQGAASGLDESRRQEVRDRRNNQQFYNGNSVGFSCHTAPFPPNMLGAIANFLQTNFEPRRDDEDE